MKGKLRHALCVVISVLLMVMQTELLVFAEGEQKDDTVEVQELMEEEQVAVSEETTDEVENVAQDETQNSTEQAAEKEDESETVETQLEEEILLEESEGQEPQLDEENQSVEDEATDEEIQLVEQESTDITDEETLLEESENQESQIQEAGQSIEQASTEETSEEVVQESSAEESGLVTDEMASPSDFGSTGKPYPYSYSEVYVYLECYKYLTKPGKQIKMYNVVEVHEVTVTRVEWQKSYDGVSYEYVANGYYYIYTGDLADNGTYWRAVAYDSTGCAYYSSPARLYVFDDEQVIEITEGSYTNYIHAGEVIDYCFTPAVSGYYYFYGQHNVSAGVVVYDSQYNIIDQRNNDAYMYDSFKAVLNLKKGETYHLVTYWRSDSEEGDVSVVLEKYVPFEIASQPYEVMCTFGAKLSIDIELSQVANITFFRYEWEYTENGEDWNYLSSSAHLERDIDGDWTSRKLRCTIRDDTGRSLTTEPITCVRNIDAIEIGEESHTSFVGLGENVVYSFTPSESGIYYFYSQLEIHQAYGYIYDSNLNRMNPDLYSLVFLERGLNFKLGSFLEKGNKYYFKVSWCDVSFQGDIPVVLEKYVPFEIVSQPYEVECSLRKNVSIDIELSQIANITSLRYEWEYTENNVDWFELSSSPKLESYVDHYWTGRKLRCKITDDMGRSLTTEPITCVRNANLIEINEGSYTNFVDVGEDVCYSFTPSVSGKYYFYSQGEGDPCVEAYDSQFKLIGQNDDGYRFGLNFKIVQDLEEGKTYYFAARWLSDQASGEISVALERYLPFDIISQPYEVECEPGAKLSVDIGLSAVSSVTTFDYRWEYMENGEDWNYLSSSAHLEHDIDGDWAGRKLRCTITDDARRSVVSKPIICVQNKSENLMIVKEPEDVEVSVGEVAVAKVEATGAGLTYQWYLKNKKANKYSKSSVTKDTYSVTMSDAVDGRTIYCVVKDRNGNKVLTKTVTLSKKVGLSIVKEPADVVAPIGSKATVTFDVIGEGLSYQWYLRNRNASLFSKSSVTKSTYSVTMSDVVNGREVYCVITDKFGNIVTTQTVTLSSVAILKIVEQPTDVYAENGKTAKTKVVATGEGLTYQWYIKNASATKFSASSVKSATYTTTMSDKVSGRQAYCIIKDGNGEEVKTSTITFHKIEGTSTLGIDLR